MKRIWVIMIVSLMGFLPLSSTWATSNTDSSLFVLETNVIPWEKVEQILEKCAKKTKMCRALLETKYLANEVTIEKIDSGLYQVTIQMASGNPVIAVIADSL